MQLLVIVVSFLAGVSLVTSSASRCYYCLDGILGNKNTTQKLLSNSNPIPSNGQCADPFNTNAPGVIVVPSDNGWCVKIKIVQNQVQTVGRGVPKPFICSSAGCRSDTVGNIPATVCCCDSDVCNAAPRLLSTMWIVSFICVVASSLLW